MLVQGDITKQETDAIVNAANSSLLGGGGVDGAIHRAAGPKLHEECLAIRARQGGCPTGRAVITSGGNLPARYVVHTVGPVWHGGGAGEAELLYQAYTNSLRLAAANGLKSIAFPSISTGAYRFPIAQAARIALRAVRAFLRAHPGALAEVRLVLYSAEDLGEYEAALRHLLAEDEQ
ncbi:MAG TPA: O-acetyl-ADP-ribose deacetylase [Firmicutes bacterium]|nr:O-acetyl-ADP-ribose deacetylase [Bacillota bacterium]